MDNIRSSTSQLVVDGPAARQVALTTLGSGGQSKKGNDISGISVENLLLSSVGRCANLMRVKNGRQVLDVSENDIGRLVLVLLVLAATDVGDVRCESSIDNDVLFASITLNGDTTDDFESVAIMDLV